MPPSNFLLAAQPAPRSVLGDVFAPQQARLCRAVDRTMNLESARFRFRFDLAAHALSGAK
jgi:hypothetical protein